MKFLWKFLICIYKCKENPYIRMLKVKKNFYLVQIEKYESPDTLIRKMKEALDAETSKAR